MDATSIRLASRPPTHCSSCYGQYPDRRHVDFVSAWDGPVLPSGSDVAGGQMVSIDELIICENCMRSAAKLLGLADWAELGERADELEKANAELRERLAAVLKHNEDLERAAGSRDSIEELIGGKRPASARARRSKRQPAAA